MELNESIRHACLVFIVGELNITINDRHVHEKRLDNERKDKREKNFNMKRAIYKPFRTWTVWWREFLATGGQSVTLI